MNTYRILYTGAIIGEREDGAWVNIPSDPANQDYQDFLEWQENLAEPLTPEAPPVVDPSVQIRQTLIDRINTLDAGHRTFVNTPNANIALIDVVREAKDLAKSVMAIRKILLNILDNDL